MKRRWTLGLLALAMAACTSDGAQDGAQAGAGGLASAGAGTTAQAAGSNGSVATAAGRGGAAGSVTSAEAGASAGTNGGAGGIGSAGSAGAGIGAGGAAGIAQAGAGGMASNSGSGAVDAGRGGTGSAHVPAASAGCGKSGRPSGGLVTVAGSHIYAFPDGYDGTAPMPLIIAFHAAGNGNDQLRNITRNSALAEHFVMAFPKSQGNGWSLNADSGRIDERYRDLTENHCVDTSRVFLTGHSSGAQLIVQLMCRGDDRFFAIAPVASSAYCARWERPIPALIIHGADDRERANTNQDADGRKDLAPYLSSNGCGMDSAPYEQAGCSSSGTQVDPGCVQYSACTEPTIWCQHDDPQYGTTNHGWPCFANAAIDRFFTGLR